MMTTDHPLIELLGLVDTALLQEITNYFVDLRTRGFVEGLNNKLKVLKRRCYGLTNRLSLSGLFLDLESYRLFA